MCVLLQDESTITPSTTKLHDEAAVPFTLNEYRPLGHKTQELLLPPTLYLPAAQLAEHESSVSLPYPAAHETQCSPSMMHVDESFAMPLVHEHSTQLSAPLTRQAKPLRGLPLLHVHLFCE
jgi:hypothetical protein